MDLDAELEKLYGLPLEDFTSARNDVARRLKDEGQAADAERVKKLKKPPVSAWAVNQLARAEPEGVARLLDLVDRLKEARSADEMHSLGAERRELVAKMARRSGELMEAAGHAASPATLQRVTQTLQAGGEDGERDLLRRGILSHDLSPTGFDALGAFGGFDATAAPPRPSRAEEELEDLRRLAAEAEEEAALLTEEAERAEAAALKASEAASDARRRAREARDKAQRAARAAG